MNSNFRPLREQLTNILGFAGIAPRVSSVVITSLAASAGIFYLAANFVGLQNFDNFLTTTFSDGIKSILDNDSVLGPTLIILTSVVIALALSFIVINRARSRGSVVFSANGVLHHHNQINISMRVATFHTMLRPLAALLKEKDLDAAFYEGGLAAGKAFAVAFPLTYRERIQEGSLPDWNALTFEQRLKFWQRYDETSGWGDIDVNLQSEGKTLLIQIFHPTLFRDVIGNAWSHFMAGYVEAFLSDISKPRGSVRFDSTAGIENNGVYISLQFNRRS